MQGSLSRPVRRALVLAAALMVGLCGTGVSQEIIGRLKEIGKWMKINGESICATSAGPFTRLPSGRGTKKLHRTAATLYLHVFNWPSDGRLVVPGLRNEVRSAGLVPLAVFVARITVRTDAPIDRCRLYDLVNQ